MKFFNLDCHIGVRDFAQICTELGHEIRLENLSDHTSLCGMKKTEKFLKYKDTWQAWVSGFHKIDSLFSPCNTKILSSKFFLII